MSKDPFALYKLPLGLAEGVEIPLAGTPAVFTVRLPGTMNEDFNMELMSRLSAEIDENGEARVDAIKFQRERQGMFFDTCIIKCEGLPDGMTAADFFAAYPLAKRSIYDRASELAVKADEEANAALGKSASLPNGKASGGVSTTNMTPSSKRGSTSKHAARN